MIYVRREFAYLKSMQLAQSEATARIETLLSRSRQPIVTASECVPWLQFPLTSTDELIEMQHAIKDTNVFQRVVSSYLIILLQFNIFFSFQFSFLGCVGGKTHKEATYAIMAKLMTNNCASYVNWTGSSSKDIEKFAFCGLTLTFSAICGK